MEFLSRAIPLYGDGGADRLLGARVCVFGLGGVGAACAEALIRAGVGSLVFVDGDAFSVTNQNRQLYATSATLGENKAAVAARRAKEINPACSASACEAFYRVEDAFDFSDVDFICDCIDDVPAKLDLIRRATEENVPIISAMGAGGKMDPTRFSVADISKTHTCPLAKKMRTELRKMGILHLPVVFSDEVSAVVTTPPSSVSFVPPVMGFVMAGYVVKTLLNKEE